MKCDLGVHVRFRQDLTSEIYSLRTDVKATCHSTGHDLDFAILRDLVACSLVPILAVKPYTLNPK